MAAETSVARCLDLLADAVWELARALPFHGHVLAALDRVVDTSVGTAAVGGGRDGRPVLFVNPAFFTKRLGRAVHRIAVLEHEVLHLVFGHLALDPGVLPDPRRRNIAADLVVNQFVTHPLPPSAVTLKTFPGFPPDRTCEDYYALLAKMSDTAIDEIVGNGDALGHQRWTSQLGDGVTQRIHDTIEAIVGEAVSRAERDGSLQGLAPALREAILRGRTARGDDPAWKRALRLFCARTLRAGMRPTTQRESRRYGAGGTRWDGPIVPGLRRNRRPALAVIVDTSGSIDSGTLTRFFEQVSRIAGAGADVHVVECDNAVRRSYPWRGELPAEAQGRGGTDFNPALQWLHDEGRKFQLAGCVYLTDGEAARPTVCPPCPLLWVIKPGGTAAHTAFGPAIPMRG